MAQLADRRAETKPPAKRRHPEGQPTPGSVRSCQMAHFYFHTRDGDRLIMDEEGLDLKDLDTARVEALKAARDMLLDARSTDGMSSIS